MTRPRLALVPFALLSGCAGAMPAGGAPSPLAVGESAPSERHVTLHVGDRRTLAPGLTGTFEAVTSDSRCAVDVTCIWAGDAVVRLKLEAGGKAATVELHTLRRDQAEAVHGGFRVRLEQLDPKPRSDRRIQTSEYEATLAIAPASDTSAEPGGGTARAPSANR